MSALAAAPAVAPVATGTIGILQGLLTGFPLSGTLGYVTLLILTVFPITGIAGINLVAVGQPLNAFLKVSSVAISLLIMTFLTPYLPIFLQSSYLNWVAGIGPWYLFDILQMLHYNEFNAKGFEPILSIPLLPSGGGKNSYWLLSATFLNILFVTILASGQVLPFIFPAFSIGGVSIGSIGNVVSIGGASLLGASFLGSVIASSFAPSIASPAALASLKLAGTGLLQGGGLPPLSSFADTLNATQTGGGSSKDMSKPDKIFLSVIGLVTVIGITLGLARQSGLNGRSV